MRHFFFLCFALTFIASLNAQNNCEEHTGKSRDNFFPTTRLILTPVSVNNNTALSFLGEIGKRNFRLNGTWGGFCEEYFRFKLGGEYLAQKLKYDFASGSEREWMHQLGLGAKLQTYYCRWKCVRGFQLSGFYSHSLGKTLHSTRCSPPNQTLLRRVAGTWFFDIEGGLMTTPCECASILYSVGYAQANYARRLENRKRLAGIAFSVDYNHYICESLGLNLRAQYTRAYNSLEALLSWCCPMEYGQLSIGAFGVHTWGKCHLPCSTIAGIELRFNFGVDRCSIVRSDRCFCGDIDSCDCDLTGLGGWVANPAVYLPQVFAIQEDKLK